MHSIKRKAEHMFKNFLFIVTILLILTPLNSASQINKNIDNF